MNVEPAPLSWPSPFVHRPAVPLDDAPLLGAAVVAAVGAVLEPLLPHAASAIEAAAASTPSRRSVICNGNLLRRACTVGAASHSTCTARMLHPHGEPEVCHALTGG